MNYVFIFLTINLITLAYFIYRYICVTCNDEKNTQDLRDFISIKGEKIKHQLEALKKDTKEIKEAVVKQKIKKTKHKEGK